MAGTLDSGCSGLGLSPGPLTNSKLGQPCKELEKKMGGGGGGRGGGKYTSQAPVYTDTKDNCILL